jgi:hypothetical protein
MGGHPTFDMGGGALGHLQVSIVTHSTRRERGSASQQGKLTVELSFKGQRVNGFLDGDGDTPPTTQLVVLERRSPTAEWRVNVQSEVVVSEGDPEYHATASFQFDASKAADEMHQAGAPSHGLPCASSWVQPACRLHVAIFAFGARHVFGLSSSVPSTWRLLIAPLGNPLFPSSRSLFQLVGL